MLSKLSIFFDPKIIIKKQCSILLTLFYIASAHAEGSRDFINYAAANGGGHRPYLEYSSNETAGIEHKAVIKVFVNQDETVHLGSSVALNTIDPSNDIVYTAPSGSTGGCDVVQGGEGSIDTLTKEAAGPAALGNADGYTTTPGGCQFTATETGIYEVEFYSADPDSTDNFGNPPKKKVNALITDDQQRKTVAAWDITVVGTDSLEKTGRVYANYLPLNMGAKNAQLNARVFILSDTGYLYRTNLNKNDPWQFMFFANNKGFKDNTGEPIYKSIATPDGNLPNNINVHNPSQPDTATEVTHKIFFNLPPLDNNSPIEADSPSGTTWLFVKRPTDPFRIRNFAFVGTEGTPNQAGVGLGGEFNFEADKNGNYILTIDANKNDVYGDENDRILTGKAVTGDVNKIIWDGLDGGGVALPAQTLPYGAKLSLIVDDVHFPFFDVENNSNGLIVERVDSNGTSVEDSTVYYNNAGLEGTGQPDPISATAGVSSNNGAQIFTSTFGNNKGIDTWTSIIQPVQLDGGVEIKLADLSVTKIHEPVNPVADGALTYTITVKNDGPNDAEGVQVQDSLPAVIDSPTWDCTATSPNQCATTSGSGDINNVMIDVASGTTVTFKVTGKIDASATGNVTNSVTITRPNDVTNPQGSEPNVDTETATDTFQLLPPGAELPIADDITLPAISTDTTTPIPALFARDPSGEAIASYSIRSLPASTQGTLYLGNPAQGGALVSLGQTLTPEEAKQLFFKPLSTAVGEASFDYTASNVSSISSEPATVTIPFAVAPTTSDPDPVTPTPIEKKLLEVTIEGSGQVTASSPGIDCTDQGGDCWENYDISKIVILTPQPAAGFKFSRWEGDCSDNGRVVMNTNRACIAYFEPLVAASTTLTVTVTGEGKVTSDTVNIVCGMDENQCTDTGEVSRKISLTAVPESGWRFEGWGEQCDGSGNVTMTTDKQCHALFVSDTAPRFTLTVNTEETRGTVTSEPSGIDCGTDCINNYASDTAVKLVAEPKPGFAFLGWTGDCSGTSNTITVEMSEDKSCTARFEPLSSGATALTVVATGQGSVTSDIAGILCGTDCTENYPENTQVKLTATPEPGFSFTGWSGSCSGAALSIAVTLDRSKTCEATFALTDDGDGIPSSVEAAAPNDGDGNKDGIPDNKQENVTSLITADKRYVTVAVNEACAFDNIQFNTENLPAEGTCTHPELLDLALDCATAEVAVYYHDLANWDDKAYRQYVTTTPGDPDTVQWSDLDVVHTVGDNVDVVTFTLTDGELGDSSSVDGYIVHTSGRTACTGTLQWSNTNYTVDEFESTATITVSRIDGSSGPVTVDYVTRSNTATQDQDYLESQGTLSWEDGDISDKSFTVTIKNDIDQESNETLDLYLSGATGGATATTEKATLTIIDDETPQSTTDTTTCNNTCQTSSCCLSACSTCQGSTSGVQVAGLAVTLEVGQALDITLVDGVGELTVKEMPSSTFVALDAWRPLGTGVAELTLRGVEIGETQMLVGDSGDSTRTTRITITVVEGRLSFGVHALTTTLNVRQTLTTTIAGGRGQLLIDELPDSTLVSLDSWLPLGNSGVGEMTLTGLRVGNAKMVISDSSTPPQKTLINIKVIRGSGGADSILIGDTLNGEAVCEANALGVNALGQSVNTSACFANQIALPQGTTRPNDSMFTHVESQMLELSTLVYVDPRHVGQVANVLLVRVHTSLTDEMRETRDGPLWHLWDDQIASLPVAQQVPALSDVLEIPIQEGDFSGFGGELTFFSGYQLLDGTVIYNGLNPLHLFIGNATSFNLRETTPKHPTSNEVHVTTFFEPLVYNAQGRKGNRLTFSTADRLHVSGLVRVDNWHVGRPADVLIVVTRRDALDQATYYYDGRQWQQWFGDIAQLQSAQHYHQLPATFEIPVALEPLLGEPASFIIFLGYRLDDYIIVFNGLEPIELSIAD